MTLALDVEALLALPQCNDPRIDAAWNDYQEHAFTHEPLRFRRQCGRCDSFAIGLRRVEPSEVAVVCLDCKYVIAWPIDRAYWMWKTFVHPLKRMLDWKIENGKVMYFETDRPTATEKG